MDDKIEQSVEKSLLSSLKSQELSKVAADIGEVTIDLITENEILKAIPIVSSIVSLNKACLSIRDRLFLKKVITFLKPMGRYSAKERKEFFRSLNEEELTKATESMLLYLDKFDSFDKSKMLSRVFENYMLGKISFNHAMYFSHFIDSVFILVWQDYYKAIKVWLDKEKNNSHLHSPDISLDDALALEKIGFYMIQFNNEFGESEYDEYRPIIAYERELVITEAGMKFIQTVYDLDFSSIHELTLKSRLNVSFKDVDNFI